MPKRINITPKIVSLGIVFSILIMAITALFLLRLGGIKTTAYLMNYYKLTNDSIVSFYIANKSFPASSNLDEIKIDKWFNLELFSEDKKIDKGVIYVDLNKEAFDRLLNTNKNSTFQIYYYKRTHFLEPVFNEEICLVETRNLRESLKKAISECESNIK